MLLLSYPPFDLEPLAWVAFVPWLLVLYEEERLRDAERLNRIRGVVLSPVILWIGFMIADYATLFLQEPLYSRVAPLYWGIVAVGALLFVYSGLMKDFPVFMGFQRRHGPPERLSYLPARLPTASQIFIPAVTWTAAEFLMMNVPVLMKIMGAFGFFSIAKTQWRTPVMLRLASYTGMYGVTFLILLVNSAIAYAVIRYRETRKASTPALATLLACLTLVAALWMASPPAPAAYFNVAVIHAPPERAEDLGPLYVDLTLQALDTYRARAHFPWYEFKFTIGIS